jgi:hypothetical protein
MTRLGKVRLGFNKYKNKIFVIPDDGICSFQEVKNFYETFVGVPKDKLDSVAKEGYRAMTAVSFMCFTCLTCLISYTSHLS